jgi:hypothetical protein
MLGMETKVMRRLEQVRFGRDMKAHADLSILMNSSAVDGMGIDLTAVAGTMKLYTMAEGSTVAAQGVAQLAVH